MRGGKRLTLRRPRSRQQVKDRSAALTALASMRQAEHDAATLPRREFWEKWAPEMLAEWKKGKPQLRVVGHDLPEAQQGPEPDHLLKALPYVTARVLIGLADLGEGLFHGQSLRDLERLKLVTSDTGHAQTPHGMITTEHWRPTTAGFALARRLARGDGVDHERHTLDD